MKTQIIISGGNSGNYKLLNSIGNDGLEERKPGLFNAHILIYSTKKQAQKALSVAYQTLIKDEPEMKGKISGITYVRGSWLSYDASKATIS